MNRKAYFLTIDVFVAIGVIVAGILIVLAQYSFKPYEPQYSFYSQDIMNTLSAKTINDFNIEGYPNMSLYVSNKNITNFDNSIYEQSAEFILRSDYDPTCTSCYDMAENLTKEIIQSAIPPEYSYNITISNSTDKIVIASRVFSGPLGEPSTMAESPYVMASKGVVSAIYGTNVAVYASEVLVWQ
jgi:hypothetical protein